MLQYVRSDLQGQGQAAIDVLRSGLSMQQDPSASYDRGRLHLALSEAFAAEHDWAQAAAAGSASAAAFAGAVSQLPAAAPLAGLASHQAVRCLLAAGRDGEAATAAAAASFGHECGPLLLAQLTQQLLVGHATAGSAAARAAAAGEQLSALADALAASRQQQKPAGGSSAGSGASAKADDAVNVLLALGHKAAGDAALAQGSLDAAATSYDAAHRALARNAHPATATSSSGSGSSSGQGATTAADAAVSSRLQQEVAADIGAGLAQVHMAGKQWDAAEEVLGDALKAAEAAAGPTSSGSGGTNAALLAPVLLLLAGGYCRSARVLLAEGLLREAAKLLGGSEPGRLLEPPSSHQAAHPSLRAAVAWRHAQLLTALPNRGGEAAGWGNAARQLWARAGPGFEACDAAAGGGEDSSTIELVLGDEAALTGQGRHGHGQGVVVSLLARRLLPTLQARAGS